MKKPKTYCPHKDPCGENFFKSLNKEKREMNNKNNDGVKFTFPLTGVSLTFEQLQIVLNTLREEISTNAPRSLNEISESFDFYLSAVSLGVIAIKYFPDEHAKYWKRDRYNYTILDDIEFKQLFELHGTYPLVREYYIIKSDGKRFPKVSTISTRLKKLFLSQPNLFEGFKTYDSWFNFYSKAYEKSIAGGLKGLKYLDDDVKGWILLFELLGSFKSVAKFLNSLSIYSESSLDPSTIQKRIETYMKNKGEDFIYWLEKYHKDYSVFESQGYKKRYTKEDDEIFIKLYEELGNFLEVATYYSLFYGYNVKYQTIISRLKNYFRENFDKWRFHYFNPISELSKIIGELLHVILEYCLVKFSINRFKCFYEVMLRFYSNNFRVDNAIILVDDQFFSKVNDEMIKILAIDYSISTNVGNYKSKLQKSYFGDEIYLFIVALRNQIFDTEFYKRLDPNLNVSILDAEGFAEFMQFHLEPTIEELFFNSINLALQVLENPDYLSDLINLSRIYNTKLESLNTEYLCRHSNYVREIRKLKLTHLFNAP